MTTPTTFYKVEDSEGNKVDEGVAAEGSFTFTIPTAPSDSYVFKVIALGDGKLVQGYYTAVLFSSYALIIDFNKNSYGPGDTMVIEYEVFALGDATLPDTFVINYGLANGPQTTLQTSAPTGSLTYIVPEDIDEGDQLFRASCDFGGDVNEVVTIKKGANPLWYLRIGDIPVFSIILFFLILISLYSVYRLRKGLAEFKRQGFLATEKARRPTHLDGTSMAAVECVECGNPIEITTSRRPIEVMCPHCGEIQHIEK
jgi:ribosomal protein S27E